MPTRHSVRQDFSPPPALRPGDRIAVIAPSSPFDHDAFEAGLAGLRQRYRVQYDEGLFTRAGYLAGDDSRRLGELTRALDDPDVRAIVAARGGYGATRLLDELPAERVARAGKLLVGFSDITALHALWARAGLRSIHGPMVAALGRGSPSHLARWFDAVEGSPPEPLQGLDCLAPGVTEGPLLGGNLAVLTALVGTPHGPPLDGAVLFLEDVGERPYRVDRMLTTLRQAGWLDRIAGIALGAFTEAAAGPDGVTVREVLLDRLAGLGVPVVASIPAGHLDDNLELPFGAPVRLDGHAGSLQFLEAAARHVESGRAH
jgi:muramoyltetrapeptide carboxypeptidase